MIVLLVLVACGAADPQPAIDADAPELAGVTLTVGTPPDETRVTLVSAWMDPGMSGGQGISAKAELPGAPPLVITGKKSFWDLKDGVVVFEGDVTAVRGAVTLACTRLEVTYKDDKVDTARATGGVVVDKGQRRATGDTATLTVPDGRLVIEGSPAIRDGNNAMTGDRITLYLDDERLECEACRLEVAGDAVKPTP